MFTLRKKVAVSVRFFQWSESWVMDLAALEAYSKSLPKTLAENSPIEGIVTRVMKTLFWVWQKSLETVVHETARLVTRSLSASEVRVFYDIARPDGSLFWNGEQDRVMKDIFLSKAWDIPLVASFNSLYK